MLESIEGIKKRLIGTSGMTEEEEAQKMHTILQLDSIKGEIQAKVLNEEGQAIAIIIAEEAEPMMKEFRFVGKLGWAWEVENSAGDDEINDLLRRHKKPANLGQKLAEQLFKETAERAMRVSAKDSYIDEDGTNLALPAVPFSPYSDQGAAFFISLAYSWRGMAEQWNSQERERAKAERDALMEIERKHMEEMLRDQTSKMIEKMVQEQADRDAKLTGSHRLEADGYIKFAPPETRLKIKRPEDFAAIFGSTITPEPELSGISKIAAGLSLGQLKKRND